MNIENNPAFLLFIEPENASHAPIIDKYTRKIAAAFRSCKVGVSGYSREIPRFLESVGCYKGIHLCGCGHAVSSNEDYFFETPIGSIVTLFPDYKTYSEGRDEGTFIRHGVIMNSLCVHYVACHRDEVSPEQLELILRFDHSNAVPTAKEVQASKDLSLVQRLLETIPKMDNDGSETLAGNLIKFSNVAIKFGHGELVAAWDKRSKEMNWGEDYLGIPSLLRRRAKEAEDLMEV